MHFILRQKPKRQAEFTLHVRVKAHTTTDNTLTFGLATEMAPEHGSGFGGRGWNSCGLRQNCNKKHPDQDAVFVDRLTAIGSGDAKSLGRRIEEGDLLGVNYRHGVATFSINGKKIAKVDGLQNITLAGVTLPTDGLVAVEEHEFTHEKQSIDEERQEMQLKAAHDAAALDRDVGDEDAYALPLSVHAGEGQGSSLIWSKRLLIAGKLEDTVKVIDNGSMAGPAILKVGKMSEIARVLVDPDVPPDSIQTFHFKVTGDRSDGIRIGVKDQASSFLLCSNGEITDDDGRKLALALDGFAAKDVIRVTVDRLANILTFYKNGDFVGELYGHLASDGDLNATVSITDFEDEVQMIDGEVRDAAIQAAKMADLKVQFAERRANQFEDLIREGSKTEADRAGFMATVYADFESNRAKIALAIAMKVQQTVFKDKRLFEKLQEIGRPLREMEKHRTIQDAVLQLSKPIEQVGFGNAVAEDDQTTPLEEAEEAVEAYESIVGVGNSGIVLVVNTDAGIDVIKPARPTLGKDIIALIKNANIEDDDDFALKRRIAKSDLSAVLVAVATGEEVTDFALAVVQKVLDEHPDAVNIVGTDGLGPLDHALQFRRWKLCKILIEKGGKVAPGKGPNLKTLHGTIAEIVNQLNEGEGVEQFKEFTNHICGGGSDGGDNHLVESILEHSKNHLRMVEAQHLESPESSTRPTSASIGERLKVVGTFFDTLLLSQNHGIRPENTNEVTPWLAACDERSQQECIERFKEVIEKPLMTHILDVAEETVRDARRLTAEEAAQLKDYAEGRQLTSFMFYHYVNEDLSVNTPDFSKSGDGSYLASVSKRSAHVEEQNRGKVVAHKSAPKSLVELMIDASKAQTGFLPFLEGCISDQDLEIKHVLKLRVGPIKKPSRLLCKLAIKRFKAKLDHLPYSEEARDVIRAMITAETPTAAKAVGHTLEMGVVKGSEEVATVVKHKDRYTKAAGMAGSGPTPGGWRDENFNIALGGGTEHITEVQVALRKMEVAREDLGGHSAFEEIRDTAAVLSMRDPPIKIEPPEAADIATILRNMRNQKEALDASEAGRMQFEASLKLMHSKHDELLNAKATATAVAKWEATVYRSKISSLEQKVKDLEAKLLQASKSNAADVSEPSIADTMGGRAQRKWAKLGAELGAELGAQPSNMHSAPLRAESRGYSIKRVEQSKIVSQRGDMFRASRKGQSSKITIESGQKMDTIDDVTVPISEYPELLKETENRKRFSLILDDDGGANTTSNPDGGDLAVDSDSSSNGGLHRQTPRVAHTVVARNHTTATLRKRPASVTLDDDGGANSTSTEDAGLRATLSKEKAGSNSNTLRKPMTRRSSKGFKGKGGGGARRSLGAPSEPRSRAATYTASTSSLNVVVEGSSAPRLRSNTAGSSRAAQEWKYESPWEQTQTEVPQRQPGTPEESAGGTNQPSEWKYKPEWDHAQDRLATLSASSPRERSSTAGADFGRRMFEASKESFSSAEEDGDEDANYGPAPVVTADDHNYFAASATPIHNDGSGDGDNYDSGDDGDGAGASYTMATATNE